MACWCDSWTRVLEEDSVEEDQMCGIVLVVCECCG